MERRQAGINHALDIPTKDLSILVDEAEKSLAGKRHSPRSYVVTLSQLSLTFLLLLLAKAKHGPAMLESLAETVAHDWEDLGSIWELGENVHASYHREMEKTWGPDHMGTLPEDYAQHVILGVAFNFLFLQTHSVSSPYWSGNL